MGAAKKGHNQVMEVTGLGRKQGKELKQQSGSSWLTQEEGNFQDSIKRPKTGRWL